MRFSRLDPPYGEYTRLSALCPENRFSVVPPDRLTGLFSDSLLNKVNSVMLMASGSGNFTTFVANMNRVDMPASAVDQEPYIVVFDHSASTASGCFVHHGSWPGRTTQMPERFSRMISASGIQAHYPLETMPCASSGSLDELQTLPQSQREAWWAALSGIANVAQLNSRT